MVLWQVPNVVELKWLRANVWQACNIAIFAWYVRLICDRLINSLLFFGKIIRKSLSCWNRINIVQMFIYKMAVEFAAFSYAMFRTFETQHASDVYIIVVALFAIENGKESTIHSRNLLWDCFLYALIKYWANFVCFNQMPK